MKLDKNAKRLLRDEKEYRKMFAGTLKKRANLIFKIVKAGASPDLLSENLKEMSREIRALSETHGRVVALEIVKKGDYV